MEVWVKNCFFPFTNLCFKMDSFTNCAPSSSVNSNHSLLLLLDGNYSIFRGQVVVRQKLLGQASHYFHARANIPHSILWNNQRSGVGEPRIGGNNNRKGKIVLHYYLIVRSSRDTIRSATWSRFDNSKVFEWTMLAFYICRSGKKQNVFFLCYRCLKL